MEDLRGLLWMSIFPGFKFQECEQEKSQISSFSKLLNINQSLLHAKSFPRPKKGKKRRGLTFQMQTGESSQLKLVFPTITDSTSSATYEIRTTETLLYESNPWIQSQLGAVLPKIKISFFNTRFYFFLSFTEDGESIFLFDAKTHEKSNSKNKIGPWYKLRI